MAACCFLCDCNLGQITSDTLKVSIEARRLAFGPFNPKFDATRLLQERMSEILPDNAHDLCSGRLRISVTRVSDGKNVILDKFNSKEEVIQALQCSSFIPLVAGIMPPTFRGIRYIDGGYSDNLPVYDRNTVTVSPFCGRSDICPQDDSFHLLEMNVANTSIDLSTQNIYRFMRVLFPPHPEILSKMCKQGFEDALRFLQKNGLISCARCIAINSTVQLNDGDGTSMRLVEDDDGLSVTQGSCTECKRQQQRARLDDLPEAVLTVFEETCASMNSGIINWIFKHKTMRMLSMLTMPYVLPVDIAYVVLSRLLEFAPKWGRDVTKMFDGLMDYARSVLGHFNKNRHVYSAKFTCQLAITEYDYDADDGYIDRPVIRKIPSRRCHHHHHHCHHNDITVVSQDELPSQLPTATPGMSQKQPADSSRVLATINCGFTADLQPANRTDLPSPFDEMKQSLSSAGFRTHVMGDGAHFTEKAVIDVPNAGLHWDSCQEDTFERILKVTRQQDALMSFYYLDYQNRLRLTEIFNVADTDIDKDMDTSVVPPTVEMDPSYLLASDEDSQLQILHKEMAKASSVVTSGSDSCPHCNIATDDDGLTKTQLKLLIRRDL